MTINKLTDERLEKILSETQEKISEFNSHCVHGSVEVNARLFETMLLELQEYRKGQAKLEWDAEQAGCVSLCLDELNVPSAGDEGPLSLWGRVYRYGEISAAERTELQEYRKAAAEPIGWTDEQELRGVEEYGCGYLFKANPVSPNADPRRVILLYRLPEIKKDESPVCS